MFPASVGRRTPHKIAVCALVCAAAGVESGCAAYHSAALTAERVNAALAPPSRNTVRIEAARLRHPILPPVIFSSRDDGLSPEQAAVFAVIANPKLRSVRDARGMAAAQVIQAGILPNPQLSSSLDVPVGNGGVPGIFKAYALNLNWEITAIFARGLKIQAAQTRAASVDLNISWQEWQAAEAAKLAVYRVTAARRQALIAEEIEEGYAKAADLLRQAVARHDKTETDLASAEAASQQARQDRLTLQQQEADERLALNQALGLPPSVAVRLRQNLRFPSLQEAKSLAARDLLAGLQERRLDLAALRLGYESQEATLRAAVRAQFPKITLGLTKASDNTNLKSLGPSLNIDLPFFDRNQGNIAVEAATRQQLADDYIGRIADARADTAKLASDLRFTAQRADAARAAVPALERVAGGYEKALGQGTVDVLLYYTALQAAGAKRLEAAKLEEDVANLVIALELVTGWPSLTSTGEKSR